MKKILFLFIATLLLQSCDDGEIIVTSFNFDEAELENCGTLGNYVFYKVNPDAQESLSLKLGVTDSLYKIAGIKTYLINGTTNFVNYRTYDGDLGSGYFCSSIPPTSPRVVVDYRAAAGIAEFSTEFLYEDGDGVPLLMELDTEDADGDGDPFTNPLDTDGDGIPNYYDFDDDGDNVPTALELDREDADGDGDPLTNPLNTDLANGDLIPNYLDEDDDGDGVLTRNEDEDGDLDPTNDITDETVGPDYLNPDVEDTYERNEYRLHTYKIFKSVKIILRDVVLENGEEELLVETLIMGTLENVETIDKETTPEF